MAFAARGRGEVERERVSVFFARGEVESPVIIKQIPWSSRLAVRKSRAGASFPNASPSDAERPKIAGIIRKNGLIFVFRHGIVFASPPSGCYLSPFA